MLGNIKNNVLHAKNLLQENSYEALFWLINILPTIGGFPLFGKKFTVPFWLLHFELALHVYLAGTVTYNQYYAKDTVDFINSFFNISLLILILNDSLWVLIKRSDLTAVLKLVETNEDLLKESGRFGLEHQQELKKVKMYVLACYTFHCVNDIFIYITSRILETNDLAISSCIGLNPLSGSPNIEICKAMLTLQELTCIVIVCSYDAMLILLTTHTTAMFEILHLEVVGLSNLVEDAEGSLVSDRLSGIIKRHAKVLDTVRRLQDLYSIVIGADIGNYAMSVCLFLMLPIDVCLRFAPFVAHNLFVFFLYCLLGQRLITASEKFEISLYASGWENFALNDKKAILFMLEQSQAPVLLKAAGIIPIRIYTFANTMQAIYKLVTVFKV